MSRPNAAGNYSRCSPRSSAARVRPDQPRPTQGRLAFGSSHRVLWRFARVAFLLFVFVNCPAHIVHLTVFLTPRHLTFFQPHLGLCPAAAFRVQRRPVRPCTARAAAARCHFCPGVVFQPRVGACVRIQRRRVHAHRKTQLERGRSSTADHLSTVIFCNSLNMYCTPPAFPARSRMRSNDGAAAAVTGVPEQAPQRATNCLRFLRIHCRTFSFCATVQALPRKPQRTLSSSCARQANKLTLGDSGL
jgi:hypothetical protein